MVWLIGSRGMLGTEISLLFGKAGIPFAGTDREVDIADPEALMGFAERRPLEWIVNCAAYTAVDRAEDDRESCRLANAAGALNIASVARRIGAKMVHISTDYVFDGNGNRPYTEDDATGPTGVYGLTKLEGELGVKEGNPESYIIRTAWLYGKHGGNFVNTMLRLMNERDEVRVVSDQRGSPTWAYDLACAIAAFVGAARGAIPFGVYHYTNEGVITWHDFASEIYRQGRELGLIARDCAVKPCTSAEFTAKAKRPAYSVLDKAKIRGALGLAIPAWDASLRKYLESL